jgi:hypothetical protein
VGRDVTSDERWPTLRDFWQGIDTRGLEPDLRRALHGRANETGDGTVFRVGPEETVVAVASRLLPGAVPARVLALFIDEAFDQQLGRGDEREGVMPRSELLPAGFSVLDAAAAAAHTDTADDADGAFARLDSAQQDELLRRAERGALGGPQGFDSRIWFGKVRELVLLAYGSDPRGMVEMGFGGPTYASGQAWLNSMEVQRRADRAPGYQRF